MGLQKKKKNCSKWGTE